MSVLKRARSELNVGQETFNPELANPLTRETLTHGYTVIRLMMVKWVNGQLARAKLPTPIEALLSTQLQLIALCQQV